MDTPLTRSRELPSLDLTTATHWVVLAFFALLFGSSAIDKWLHFPQFLTAVGGYVLVPPSLAQTIAVFVASLEIWLAAGFLVPAWRKPAATLATGTLLVFAAALAANYHYGVLSPCGCWFSVTLSQATLPHIIFDVVLAGLAMTGLADKPSAR
jgi:uncharacterized membrane protein YphA (DoxX/SURF4 family)